MVMNFSKTNTMSRLVSNRYGKHRVRVLKVIRDSEEEHRVCELEVDILLSGELEASYLSDDNSSIVPTDTCKNTIHALAHDHLETCRTQFAKVLGEHFLAKYDHISGVDVEIRERSWERMKVAGREHPHAFTHRANGEMVTLGRFRRGQGALLRAGIRDFLVMKTTASGFVGYNQCELTTLPETTDRILSSRVTALWRFSEDTEAFAEVDGVVLECIQRVFAETYSPSVQRTLYEIGEAVLAAVPQVVEVELTMPNVHFLGLDLGRLGRPDQSLVFLPTDEPHGQIMATVARSDE